MLLQKFRTWAALETALTGEAAGVRAVLYGPSAVIGEWVTDGSDNFSLVGTLDFTACDGSEFTIATSGSPDIEGLDGVAPTLTSAGLDVSLVEGVVALNFLQVHGAIRSVQALYNCDIPNVADGQVVAVGNVDLYGGVSYASGTTSWNRSTYSGDPPAKISSYHANNTVTKPGTAQAVFAHIATGNDAGNTAPLLGGAFEAGDSAPWQAAHTAISSTDLSSGTPALLYCEGKSAASFSAVVEKITAVGGLV